VNGIQRLDFPLLETLDRGISLDVSLSLCFSALVLYLRLTPALA
jgi:hypothetical protein